MSVEPHALQDTVMLARLRSIIHERNVKVVVETGIDRGWSTAAFSRLVDLVVGIDISPDAIECSYHNLKNQGCDNALLVCDNSPDALRKLRPFLPDKRVLYFLDAHWGDYWPLLDEIVEIWQRSGVIVFHDMVVPGHPELGFDTYGGQTLNYEYVRPALMEWSPNHRIEYNERAECPFPRGVGYVFPE